VGEIRMKVSLVMGSFKRAHLLDLNLRSLTMQIINNELEIIMCNDGIIDDTESICKKYQKDLNIKYLFTGKRNYINEIKPRSPGYALNIAVRQSKGEVIIITSPEVFHLNDTIDLITNPLKDNKKLMVVGKTVFFDDTGNTVKYLQNNYTRKLPNNLLVEIQEDKEGINSVQMPYLMGMMRQEYMDIHGYDEDCIGYAGTDNDFVERMKCKGLKHYRTNAEIIHLYHGKRCDSRTHWDNPKWTYNYNLFLKRKGIIIRNKDREWGGIK